MSRRRRTTRSNTLIALLTVVILIVLGIFNTLSGRNIVRNGLIQLKSVSSPILGVVLNGVDMDRDGYYYYQYYYYYYGEDGSKKKRVHTKKRSKIGYGQEADR